MNFNSECEWNEMFQDNIFCFFKFYVRNQKKIIIHELEF